MSKKLLSEAQVRRFQSLASIQPLAEMSYNEEKHEEEKTMEEAYNEELVNEEEAELAPEADEPEMEEADVEMDEELVQKFMDAVDTMKEVADVLGGEVEDAMGEEEPMDLGMISAELRPELCRYPDDEDEEKKEDEMLEEALRGINYIPSKKEIVKTVAQRVAKRLNEAKLAEAKLNKALGRK